MKLYYFSGACSLASNIALREAGLKFELVKVDHRTKRTADGLDFSEVNPKRYVPALRLDNGEVLTENIAVLLYIADRNPASQLAPTAGTLERYRLLEWLAFISSEVHKNFSPLSSDEVPEEAKKYARKVLGVRLDYLNRAIGERAFLSGEPFTVADAYLFTVLRWGRYMNVDLGQWAPLQRYVERVSGRPQVIEALKSEGLLR